MKPTENLRCAIYTRKSTDRGLDMNVTSLTAQREVCQSYIKCQAHRKWREIPQAYDDGGFSGGTLERPGLKRLIGDIEAGRVDVIIIYKIDRLTRSLLDFVRLIEVLERNEVSFVSVTEAFDTSDSMGRLILNILLTFAQFERELMSDRVRDKKAAMQRKGYFVGGLPPFGYLVDSGGRLCLDEERAPIVRELYDRYLSGASVKSLADDLGRRRLLTRYYVTKAKRRRGGKPVSTAIIRRVLENPVYTGHIVHRGDWVEAQIDPLITREVWDLAQQARLRRAPKLDHDRNFLVRLLHDDVGRPMKIQEDGIGRTIGFRYYRSEAAGWSRGTEQKAVMVLADDIEHIVKSSLSQFLRNRGQVREAVMADAFYSPEIARLLKAGSVNARRLDCMSPARFRRALLALVPRINISGTQVELYVSCNELKRLLAWDGQMEFAKREGTERDGSRVFIIEAPASLLRNHPHYSLPIVPRGSTPISKGTDFANLLREAALLRQAILSERDKSLLELAAEQRMTQSRSVRVVRLNYLAPDIQVAMVDGTLPAGISSRRLMDAAMVLDWQQQRHLLSMA